MNSLTRKEKKKTKNLNCTRKMIRSEIFPSFFLFSSRKKKKKR